MGGCAKICERAVLTILTALPWEAGAFSRRLRYPRRVELGDGWATWGERKRDVGTGRGVRDQGAERATTTGAALASLEPPASKLLAVGVAGGMRAGLTPGMIVLAEAFQRRERGGQQPGKADSSRTRDLTALGVNALERARVQWTRGENLTVTAPLLRAKEKRDWGGRSQASVVQMEDYLWAEAAGELGLPFTSLRDGT